VFYASLRPVHHCAHKLVCALVGMYVVQEVVSAATMAPARWHENAHVRKMEPGKSDIVVRAKPHVSGRFDRCIPIGQWHSRAYRVRQDLLKAWRGLSVKDGFIQLSGTPLWLSNPELFLSWLKRQAVQVDTESGSETGWC